MMGKKSVEDSEQIAFISLDDMVEKNQLLRKIEKAFIFDFIYDLAKELYSLVGKEKYRTRDTKCRRLQKNIDHTMLLYSNSIQFYLCLTQTKQLFVTKEFFRLYLIFIINIYISIISIYIFIKNHFINRFFYWRYHIEINIHLFDFFKSIFRPLIFF